MRKVDPLRFADAPRARTMTRLLLPMEGVSGAAGLAEVTARRSGCAPPLRGRALGAVALCWLAHSGFDSDTEAGAAEPCRWLVPTEARRRRGPRGGAGTRLSFLE